MAVGAGPTVRQRQLGMRLRAIRREKNLSVEAVAKELDCSPSKISRLETATRPPNWRDVRDLCALYRLDEATSAELVELAREAKEQGWWKAFPDVGLQLVPYIGLEQDASSITSFAAFYVPALLQTAEYARAMISGIAPRMSPDVLTDRVAVRLRRQDILDRDTPLRYRVFIDESVLHRPTGGPGVMIAQIDKILGLIDEKKVTAQIVPFDVGVLATQDSNFVLLEFDNRDLSPVVFVEGLQNGQLFEKEADVARYRESIDYLRDSALNPAATQARFIQLRKRYENDSQ
jgi:transcriptional regulator with XRE-family HTH domain